MARVVFCFEDGGGHDPGTLEGDPVLASCLDEEGQVQEDEAEHDVDVDEPGPAPSRRRRRSVTSRFGGSFARAQKY